MNGNSFQDCVCDLRIDRSSRIGVLVTLRELVILGELVALVEILRVIELRYRQRLCENCSIGGDVLKLAELVALGLFALEN